MTLGKCTDSLVRQMRTRDLVRAEEKDEMMAGQLTWNVLHLARGITKMKTRELSMGAGGNVNV